MNEQRQLLEQPFSPDQIKTRPGSFGKVLNYVETHHVVKRLNEVFEKGVKKGVKSPFDLL